VGSTFKSPVIFVRTSSKKARARAQDRRVAVTFCDRIDEPINLAIDFAESQLKVRSLGIRFGCEAFTFFVIDTYTLGDHARMPHLSL
jgi:hypothetical protein